MNRRLLAAVLLVVTGAGPVAPRERAPRLHVESPNQLPQPLPAPYDSAADANARIAAALRRARAEHKPLILDFGANWCADCRVLAGVLDLPEMRGWVARRFEIVQIDVGRFDRNLDVVHRFGPPLEAIPAVFVIDPATGALRNRGQVLALGDARVMKPQAVADWLARWAR
jgi:thiol:disulfide interchange protein